jgi:DNA repair exonuclease SbcCD ATPase subunit
MICRIRLEHWRSYDAIDLKLTSGTTFIVAANGVGKTSLVLGLAWAVFGERCGFDPRSCIRAGATTASAQVELLLDDGRELSIVRRVSQRGKPHVAGTLDGTAIDATTVDDVLTRSFGVDLNVAARLAVLTGGGMLAAENELNLTSHLYRALGVADLLSALEEARSIAKEARKARADVRSDTQSHVADRAHIETEISALGAQLEHDRKRGRELEDQVRTADRARHVAERAAAYAAQLEESHRELAVLMARVGAVLEVEPLAPSEGAVAAAAELLRIAQDDAQRTAQDAANAHAAASAVVAVTNEAIQLLEGGAGRCPTCLRDLSAGDLLAARSRHRTRVEAAASEAQAQAKVAAGLRSKAAKIVEVLGRVHAYRRPQAPEGVDAAVGVSTAEAAKSQAFEKLQLHNKDVGGLETRIALLRAQIASDDRLRRDEERLRAVYRREAIADATVSALETATTEISTRMIEPVASAVRVRWNSLFGAEGLTFKPDGNIVRIAQGRELGWETLSGGERVWARVVTHLLILASFTKLPFAWFDEPLEHLDPQLRHAVATALAVATRNGRPRQLLVTTYENGIARQLAEDIDETSIVSVRAGLEAHSAGPPSDEDAEEAGKRRAS